MARGCSVPGCTRPRNSQGLCGMHGLRLARHGDVHNPGAFIYSETGLCTVEGCSRKHCAKGFCGMHYQRAKNGRLDLAEVLTCARCSAQFPRPYKGSPDAVRFCSHECRYAAQLEGYRANRAARTEYLRKWRKRNPEKVTAILLARKAAKRTGDVALVSSQDLSRLVHRYRGRCAYCGIRAHEHFDHIIPLARGGRHSIGNLLPSCAKCNLAKGSRLLADWRIRPSLPRQFQRTTRGRSRGSAPARCCCH
jgi:5-methylcytosine-specific restriction endonuclease McrA